MAAIEPLTREQTLSVLAGKADTPRVPVHLHFWVHPEAFGDREPAVRELLERYTPDFQALHFKMPNIFRTEDDGQYAWLPWEEPAENTSLAIDERIGLKEWDRLDEVLEQIPRRSSTHDLFAHESRGRVTSWFILHGASWAL